MYGELFRGKTLALANKKNKKMTNNFIHKGSFKIIGFHHQIYIATILGVRVLPVPTPINIYVC